jgi:hypothetical protein
MDTLEVAVNELAPQVFAATIEALDLPFNTDMTRSNRCDRLTLEMYSALGAQGLEARRELHRTADGLWHYVIAHASPDAEPSQQDIVSDFNPWQWGATHRSGVLHGKRLAVQETLGEAGAPAWFVSLRGIATIVEAHTLKLNPFRR